MSLQLIKKIYKSEKLEMKTLSMLLYGEAIFHYLNFDFGDFLIS